MASKNTQPLPKSRQNNFLKFGDTSKLRLVLVFFNHLLYRQQQKGLDKIGICVSLIRKKLISPYMM